MILSIRATHLLFIKLYCRFGINFTLVIYAGCLIPLGPDIRSNHTNYMVCVYREFWFSSGSDVPDSLISGRVPNICQAGYPVQPY